MIKPAYLNVLRKIYIRLNNTNVNWVVTGSLSFALQGIPVEPNDIDIQTVRCAHRRLRLTAETGAYEIERRFSEFVIRRVTFSSFLMKECLKWHG